MCNKGVHLLVIRT